MKAEPIMMHLPMSRCGLWIARLTVACCCIAGLAVAQQVPRAIPVDPGKVPRAVPVEDPSKPKGRDEDLYDYAMLSYTQKDYHLALKPFSDYVRLYPQGSHAADAWFRLGECYQQTNQLADAERCYSHVLKNFAKSESAASAAYRLGTITYGNNEFLKAAQYFESCQKITAVPAVRLAAISSKALCYKLGNLKIKALATYKMLAEIKEENPFRETALLEVATAELETGKKEDALKTFEEIITIAKDNAILGDALLKSGLVLNELGKTDAAFKNFKRALELKELPADKRGVAVFGMIEAAYAKGDYDAVIDTYTRNPTLFPPEDLRAKLMLYVGLAQKQRKSYRQAISIFLMLESQHPSSPEAFEGAYQKLLCFYQLDDKDFPKFSEDFETTYHAAHSGHEYLAMAQLLRADWYFSKANYPQATKAFSNLDLRKVPEKVRASATYRKGFAEAEAGNYNDATVSLSAFITDYPQDVNIPVALAQRGISRKAMNDFAKALGDFAAIIKDYPSHPAAEMAYYQSALIKAETRDTASMIADLETLVTKFPKTAAAADAYYRIGRGYFDLKTKDGYAKAIEPLRKAIALDSKEWFDKASQLLISCQYLREDLDALAKEVDAYIKGKNNASISPKVLEYLGGNYFNRGDFRAAAHYLQRAITPDDPQNTEATVWNYLGMAELENKNYQTAVTAMDNYLAQTPDGLGHAKGLLTKGRALLGLNKFADAEKCVIEGLQKVKDGRLHFQLSLLQGDIALVHGDALAASGDQANAQQRWKQAAGNFVLVSQFFVDPEITPEALAKAVKALERIGDKEKTATLRKQLERDYPKYKPQR